MNKGYEEAEKYLKDVRGSYFELERLEEEIKDLEADIMCISSPAPDNEHVDTSAISDRTRQIDKLVDMKRNKENEVVQFIQRKHRARILIEQLENSKQRTVLIEYYLNHNTMEQVAEGVIDKSLRHTYRIRTQALKSFQKVLKGAA